MSVSSTFLARSYSGVVGHRGALVLKVAVALLVTAVAALILIHVEARGGMLPADLDLVPLLY